MKKIQLGRDALILSIMTLITVLSWIGFDVYQALTKTEMPRVLKRQLAPLNPRLNRTVIDKLRKRETLSQEELSKLIPPAITPSPETTPSGKEAEE